MFVKMGLIEESSFLAEVDHVASEVGLTLYLSDAAIGEMCGKLIKQLRKKGVRPDGFAVVLTLEGDWPSQLV